MMTLHPRKKKGEKFHKTLHFQVFGSLASSGFTSTIVSLDPKNHTENPETMDPKAPDPSYGNTRPS